jgi:hypothetical protein
VKQLRVDVTQLARKSEEMRVNLRGNIDEVEHIKDAVATKANYSDLVMYFDKKADKQ